MTYERERESDDIMQGDQDRENENKIRIKEINLKATKVNLNHKPRTLDQIRIY